MFVFYLQMMVVSNYTSRLRKLELNILSPKSADSFSLSLTHTHTLLFPGPKRGLSDMASKVDSITGLLEVREASLVHL